ncbi:MAG TPA: AAA family ATPase [Patescibacteria group bacterium]|nr:AAA family ATPase [Patescibacteria group bacterium]
MKLIGIGGLPRSGKDTVAELLIAEGWFGISFGDVVRVHAFVRHKGEPDPISVANMTDTSNWLRETQGPDVILQEAIKQFNVRQHSGKQDKGLVLWSVRAPVEVDFILSHGGELIWVETSDEVRYERGMQNLREGEAKISLEEFKRQEQLQWQPQPGIPKEVQMDISYVKNHATKTIENNGNDVEAFKRTIEQALGL